MTGIKWWTRAACAGFVVFLAAACGGGGTHTGAAPTSTTGTRQSSTTSPATSQTAAGKEIFETAGCKGCHTLKEAGATGTVGPNLDDVKPSLSAIIHQITGGGKVMPPFGVAEGGKLSSKQVKDVAMFVYAAERGGAGH